MRNNPLVAAQSRSIVHLTMQLGIAQQRITDLERQLEEKDRFWLDRVRELEDSTRALSLDQLRGLHPTVAMEARPPDPPRKLFHTDPTGMIVTEVDPADYPDLELG